ncbi:hypothetical protein DF186_23900, partial [Enterococcus hirae]
EQQPLDPPQDVRVEGRVSVIAHVAHPAQRLHGGRAGLAGIGQHLDRPVDELLQAQRAPLGGGEGLVPAAGGLAPDPLT